MIAACRVLYGRLNDFISDFYMHIHLDNNILFPKARAIEERWMGKAAA